MDRICPVNMFESHNPETLEKSQALVNLVVMGLEGHFGFVDSVWNECVLFYKVFCNLS